MCLTQAQYDWLSGSTESYGDCDPPFCEFGKITLSPSANTKRYFRLAECHFVLYEYCNKCLHNS